MCTIALAFRLLENTPVAIGANREEHYDRPAAPPAILESRPRVVAPRDLAAGGTWIAINEHGLLVAITNRPGGPTGERSRGLLVRDLADTRTVARAIARTRVELDRADYAGFTLLLADRHRAVTLQWDGALTERELHPGIHVIVNEGIDDDVGKSSVVRARLQAVAPSTVDEWRRRCATVLCDHGLGVCRHGEQAGTRSSSILWCDTTGRIEWLYADGPPCRHQYRRVHAGPLSGSDS